MSAGETRRLTLPKLVLVVAVAAVATALGLWAFAASHDRISVVIPSGTSDRIAARQELSVLPNPVKAEIGDTLVLTNKDDRIHTFDGVTVAPGATVEISLSTGRDSMVSSSVANNGEIRLIVS